jgi:predicted MFS family arabinose efflux permease
MGLILTGICLSITNIAMNTCVTAIEHEDQINIMSTCHGMFSAGLMLGSIMASILIGFQINPTIHVISVSSVMILLAFYVRPIIMNIHEEKVEESGAKFSFPKGALLMMILISICINVTEGSMADWTAVYMREVVHTNDYFIGWGLAGYSMFMATGRFVGDSLIPKYGTNHILIVGGIVSALGLSLALLLPYTFTAIIGFALVGAGVSCGAPIMYGSAARIPNMAKGAGLATMNTFSMLGFLAGPVLIGFISKSVNLSFAFVVVGILGLIWAFLVSKVKLY